MSYRIYDSFFYLIELVEVKEIKEKWLGPESNQRHMDFQSTALPTELPSHKKDVIHLKSGAKLLGHYSKTKIFDQKSAKYILLDSFSESTYVFRHFLQGYVRYVSRKKTGLGHT